MASPPEEGSPVLATLYYVYPAAIFAFCTVASFVAIFTLKAMKQDEKVNARVRPGRKALVWCLSLFIASYAAQLLDTCATAFHKRAWDAQDQVVVGRLSCILVFGIQLSYVFDTKQLDWARIHGCIALALPFEIAITVLEAQASPPFHSRAFKLLQIAIAITRALLVFSMVLAIAVCRWISVLPPCTDEETEPLLPKSTTEQPILGTATTKSQNKSYGTAQDDDDSDVEETRWERQEREETEAMQKRLKEQGNWFQYVKGFSILLPYVWPFGNVPLQLRALGVIFCLLASNALHVLIPRQTGIIMDSFGSSATTSPWLAVLMYALLRLMSSECGVDLIRQWLWTPVKYYSREAMTRAAFSHMMHLSADFHDSKSSSDMLMAVSGGQAISNAVESVLLQAVPMLIDMGVAIVYLSVKFGPYEGLITVATGTIFLHCASRLVERTKRFSRKRRNALYKEHKLRHSGLIGWQTVSAFNQIGYEDNRHADAVASRWLKEQQYVLGWQVSIAFQTLVLTCGLLASAFLAVGRIQAGNATPGQFAMLLMYWAQLTSPLQFFARLGKSMSDDFIDAERLLDVMKTNPSVENKPNARPLKYMSGKVEFEDVYFTYDKQKPIIEGLNLTVPAGERIAFVGATGAGKSTLLKLLFRYYDTTSGTLRIDDQDIRDVDLFSLRDRIGIVPQTPVLFDDTILNNVRYAKITATDEEVHEACRAACIHDKILGFTDGYETKIGERGVKLSGGELQRVAIARAILKDPDIVLLDEATSAVDTDTEHKIQLSFESLCRGRTTFIVAHRLSTIMNADRIVVIEQGQILEQGTHYELLAAQGRYADLWSKQGFLGMPDKNDLAAANAVERRLFDTSAYEATSNSNVSATESDSDSETQSSNKGSQVDFSLLATHTQQPNTDCSHNANVCSKLNPVAPEFTPQTTKPLLETISSPYTPKTVTTESPLESKSTTSRLWSDDVAAEESEQKAAVSIAAPETSAVIKTSSNESAAASEH